MVWLDYLNGKLRTPKQFSQVSHNASAHEFTSVPVFLPILLVPSENPKPQAEDIAQFIE